VSRKPPTMDAVRAAVRMALYSPDPLDRAEASSDLICWGLPVSPDAMVMAAERLTETRAIPALAR